MMMMMMMMTVSVGLPPYPPGDPTSTLNLPLTSPYGSLMVPLWLGYGWVMVPLWLGYGSLMVPLTNAKYHTQNLENIVNYMYKNAPRSALACTRRTPEPPNPVNARDAIRSHQTP